MKRSFEIKFWESFLPTPRHRILRERECREQIEVEIPELTLAEAPVAIRHKGPRGLRDYFARGRGVIGRRRLDYHWHAGRLYTRVRLSNFVCLTGCWENDKKDRSATIRDIYYSQYGRSNRDEALAKLHSHMDRFRIINGHLCEVIGEPRYVVMTFGLGHNHGGTALMVDHGFNPNILTDRYYRIDQEAEARKAAIAVAKRRGDTNNIPRLRQRHYERFQILIPEAVRMQRQDHGPDDEFTQQIAGLTDSGLPPMVAAFALLGVAHSIVK